MNDPDVSSKPGSLVQFTRAEIEKLFAVNVNGVIWGLQLAHESMNDAGRVITTSEADGTV